MVSDWLSDACIHPIQSAIFEEKGNARLTSGCSLPPTRAACLRDEQKVPRDRASNSTRYGGLRPWTRPTAPRVPLAPVRRLPAARPCSLDARSRGGGAPAPPPTGHGVGGPRLRRLRRSGDSSEGRGQRPRAPRTRSRVHPASRHHLAPGGPFSAFPVRTKVSGRAHPISGPTCQGLGSPRIYIRQSERESSTHLFPSFLLRPSETSGIRIGVCPSLGSCRG